MRFFFGYYYIFRPTFSTMRPQKSIRRSRMQKIGWATAAAALGLGGYGIHRATRSAPISVTRPSEIENGNQSKGRVPVSGEEQNGRKNVGPRIIEKPPSSKPGRILLPPRPFSKEFRESANPANRLTYGLLNSQKFLEQNLKLLKINLKYNWSAPIWVKSKGPNWQAYAAPNSVLLMRGEVERVYAEGEPNFSQGSVFVRVVQGKDGKLSYRIDGPTTGMKDEYNAYPKGASYSLEQLEAAGMIVERVYAPSKN